MLNLLLLAACTTDGIGLYTDPPDPTFASLSATCDADVLTVTALVDGELPTSNVVLVPTEADGFQREVVYPVTDLTQGDGRITRWTADLVHDCDDDLVLDWSAYTTMGTGAHASSRYPLTPPEVEGLTPPYGSTAGGDEVYLTGPWLSEVSGVTIGGAAATLLEADDAGLWLETPAGAAGLVDVVLTGEGGETTLADAFTYYEDKSDQARGIGNFNLSFNVDALVGYDSAYGSFDGPFAQFEAVFHAPLPIADHWWARWPDAGDCGIAPSAGFDAFTNGNYVDLVHDGDLGAFAMVTRDEGTTYYLAQGGVTVEDWTDQRFDLAWSGEQADWPAMALPDGFWSAPFPEAMSIDWEQANTLVRGDDIPITFVPDADITSTLVSFYVTRGNASVLGSASCADDPSDGDLSLPWATLMDGVDPAQAANIYLRIDFFRDQPIVLPHDHSLFWARGVTTVWYRFNLQ
jgi:hypothetical protein